MANQDKKEEEIKKKEDLFCREADYRTGIFGCTFNKNKFYPLMDEDSVFSPYFNINLNQEDEPEELEEEPKSIPIKYIFVIKEKGLFDSGLPKKEDYVMLYFGKATTNFVVLNNEQIFILAEHYRIKFEVLCVEKAKKMKSFIQNEYGKIQGLKTVPLRSIFSFDLGTRIRKVERRENVVLSQNTLNSVKEEISKYKASQKTLFTDVHKESYDKIYTFINEHLKFSEFIESKKTGKFKISDIKFAGSSGKLELRSWLIENIRYAFPKKFGIPLDNNLLSWFIYGDSPEYGEHSVLNKRLMNSEVYKRFELRDLLGIDYRVTKLTKLDFKRKEIAITQDNLESLQKNVANLIYEYIVFKEHDKPYISDVTSFGINVGRVYWSPEYFVVRAVFFASAEANSGEIQDFKTIGDNLGIEKIQRNLRGGYGFGKTVLDVLKYVEDLYNKRPINSNVDIFKEAIKILEEYDEIYFMRSKARGDALGEYDSEFEKSVHHYLMREISPLFDHDITVIEAIGKREVVVQDEDGNDMIRRLHFQFHYDCYLKLDRELRNYFGLDDRWKGIAVEVMGIYWHGQDFPVHIERDKFKKAVSMQENIIQIDIWEDVEQDQWINEFITQLNEQAGTSITKNDLSKIKNYLV